MICPECNHDNPDNTKFCGNCATPLPDPEEILDSPTETMEVPLMLLKTGSVLSNRYEIIEEIGKGGMGKVYKVLDREINERIALKLLRPEIASRKEIVERFRNELKMARKISHKNACRMYDIGKDGDSRYITMEYVSGEDLKKSIRRMGPLTLKKTLSISRQICQGLSEAHHLGIVHRDLKPQNIMIDREGNTKIMDFGIALSQEARGITDSNIMMGTPHYLSPEQFDGKRADERSDIYSLGTIIFEMVTGQVPFDGENALSIAVKHKTEKPLDPRESNPQIPEELRRLILKCMEKNPSQRYQTATELYSALSSLDQSLPTAESTIVRGVGTKKIKEYKILQPRYRIWATVFFLALVALIGYLGLNKTQKSESSSNVILGASKWKDSIAIFPFKDLSRKTEQGSLSLIMADSLIVKLHSFRELRVLSLTSALAFVDSNKDIQSLGRDLRVNNILEGTVQRTEKNLRVSAQLCRVEDSSIIWAEAYDTELENYAKTQDEIIKSVARVLGVQNVDGKYTKVVTADSSESLPSEYYARGRHFELRFYSYGDLNDFKLSVQNYQEAADANPNDAKTFWRLGNLYEARYNTYDKHPRYLDLMFTYYLKAYEIDSHFAEANMGLSISYFYKKNDEKAYEYMKKAYELDPNNSEINHQIGAIYRSIGLYQKALEHYAKAISLDPFPLEFVLWHYVRADCLSMLGRFEEAADILRKAMETQPNIHLNTLYLRQLFMMDKLEEFESELVRAEELYPDESDIRHYRALLCAAQGNRTKALELIADAEEPFRYRITCIYSLLGMTDEAIRNIKLGIDGGFERVRMYLYSYPWLIDNPCYDNLRNDPRFQAIVSTEKAKYEEKLGKYPDF